MDTRSPAAKFEIPASLIPLRLLYRYLFKRWRLSLAPSCRRWRAAAFAAALLPVAAASQEALTAERARALSFEATERLKSSNPEILVQHDLRTGFPKVVRGLSDGVQSAAEKSSVVNSQAQESTAENFFKGGVGRDLFPPTTGSESVRVVGSRPDPEFSGSRLVDMQQTYAGLEVLFARAKVKVDPTAAVTSLTSSFTPVGDLATNPAVTESAAIEIAKAEYRRRLDGLPADVRAQINKVEGENPAQQRRLVIFDPKLANAGSGEARLAWLVEFGNFHIVIDAQAANILFFYRDAPSALLQRIFDFAGQSAVPAAPVLVDPPDPQPPNISNEVADVRDQTRRVYDYFFSTFGRDGFDDNHAPGPAGGSAFVSYVRIAGLANALWCKRTSTLCPASKAMVYGPGYTKALDIVGHEIGHGVIQHEADLIYQGEAGALNEAIADIFGVLIKISIVGGNNWIIGENLPQHSAASPLRDMKNPHSLGFNRNQDYGPGNTGQPDHYSELVRFDSGLQTGDQICGSTTDSLTGCVHFNSGVINKAASLLAEGGSHHSVAVTKIGPQKLARLIYRTLTAELTPTSNFADFAAAAIRACSDLTSAGALQDVDCAAVRAAFNAVGIVPST